MRPEEPDAGFFLACRRTDTRLTRWVVVVSIRTQTLLVCEQERDPAPIWAGRPVGPRPPRPHRYQVRQQCRISSSRFGTGQVADSHRTPLGLHRVAQKIGGGWPIGAVFRGRRLVGFTWQGLPRAPIAHRILWLEGLEAGFNRGGAVDSFARYIYLHGAGDETTLGSPATRGCVHLAAARLLPLYDLLPVGTLVWIRC